MVCMDLGDGYEAEGGANGSGNDPGSSCVHLMVDNDALPDPLMQLPSVGLSSEIYVYLLFISW